MTETQQHPPSPAIADLIDWMGGRLDDGFVPASIFNDAAVYQAEVDKIWPY